MKHETCQTNDNGSGWACRGMNYHVPTEDKPIMCFLTLCEYRFTFHA